MRYGRISGLTLGTSYTFIVRATSAGGPSAASNAVTAAPQAPIGPVTNIKVAAVPGQVTVTWDPPALPAGRSALEYQADIVSVDNPNSSGEICTVHPGWGEPLICVYNGAPAGEQLEVQIGAWDEYGQLGLLTEKIQVTVPFPVPATVPASHGALIPGAGSSDKVVAGKSMVVTGTGYRPGSTVQLVIYSTPQVLTSVVADGGGSFTVTVPVPAGLAAGQHTLVASGVDSSGNARYMNLPVTVSKSGVATLSGRRLASTGTDVTVPLLGGVAALAVGGGLIMASRRRAAA
jgi:LPXTG-motif cell wall-anchored protein